MQIKEFVKILLRDKVGKLKKPVTFLIQEVCEQYHNPSSRNKVSTKLLLDAVEFELDD